jgi:hypothetical protein
MSQCLPPRILQADRSQYVVILATCTDGVAWPIFWKMVIFLERGQDSHADFE